MSSHQSCGIDLENGAHCMVVTTTISQIRYSNHRAPRDFQHEHGQKTLLQPHLTGGNQQNQMHCVFHHPSFESIWVNVHNKNPPWNQQIAP